MRLYNYLLLALLVTFTITSCKKDLKEETPPTTTTTACNGKNLCLKINSKEENHDARWKILSDRYRIYWEEGTGLTYRNIELDIYATVVGTYPIAASPATAQSRFQYYIADGDKNIQGESGNIEITAIANNKITGTFTVNAKDDSGKAYQVTEGQFVNVGK